MPPEFDPYAQTYDRVLADAVGIDGDVDRFAAYKIEEIAHRMLGRPIVRVLDFGCGVGRGLPFIASAFPGSQVWGFDPSIESIEAAHRREPRARVTADWKEIPEGGFDCVVAANVFHHVPESSRLAEMQRCAGALRRAGSLFVFEHNPVNPLTRHVFERCPFDRDASMIPRSEIARLGTRAGLEVHHAAYTLFLPSSGKVAMTLQRLLAWLPLGAQYYVQFVR